MNLKVFVQNTVSSWLDSLAIFRSQALKLFLLVTLKTYVTTLRHLLTQFWWTLPIFVALFFIATFGQLNAYLLYDIMINGAIAAAFFILFLTIRPSVALKDYAYYRSYMPAAVFMWLAYIIGYIICFGGLLFVVVHIMPLYAQIGLGLFLKYGLLLSDWLIFSPLLLLILFFYMDSTRSFKAFLLSIRKALRFLWRNYPLIVVSTLLLRIIFLNVLWAIAWFNAVLALPGIAAQLIDIIIESLLIYPLVLAWYNNLYIKRVYDHMKLYID